MSAQPSFHRPQALSSSATRFTKWLNLLGPSSRRIACISRSLVRFTDLAAPGWLDRSHRTCAEFDGGLYPGVSRAIRRDHTPSPPRVLSSAPVVFPEGS